MEQTESAVAEQPANPLELQKKQHNAPIDDVINRIKENKSTVYMYSPAMNIASGGIGVLLKFARILKDSGTNVKVIYEPHINQKASYEESMKQKKQVDVFEKFAPKWLDFKIDDLEFIALGDKDILFDDKSTIKGQPLAALPEDFLIVPEGFPGILEKTVQVPYKKIVLAQSWLYILNALQPGQKYQNFGVKDVISVSDAITEYLNAVMPGLSIKNFKQGINRKIFKAPAKISQKFPMVAFTGSRGPENKMKTHNIIRMFYAIHPHLRWIRFIELSGMDREKFAETLASCAFFLYTDDVAGFGTIPLESMSCNSHTVGFSPFGGKEYISGENGFWCANGDIFGAAELLGVAVDKYLRSELDLPEITEAYEKVLSNYTEEGEKSQIINIINEYKNERIAELESIKK